MAYLHLQMYKEKFIQIFCIWPGSCLGYVVHASLRIRDCNGSIFQLVAILRFYEYCFRCLHY
uniref:Uncharacterized protein n=1 Tax=Arundo donax TaxID=35708 RepID=A0A0A9HN70_ARUDO